MTVTQGDELKAGPAAQKVVYVVPSSEFVSEDDEFDLGRMIWVVWSRKWWVAAFTALITLLAVAYSFMATEWYRAEAVMIPRESTGGMGLSSGLAQFGGLADLAGINLGQNGRQEPVGVLKSKGFSRRFIQQNDLVDVLREGLADDFTRSPVSEQLDVRDVVDGFRRSILTISEDKKSGLVTVAIDWWDALGAADLANKITQQINAEMRMRALVEANRNIDYLRDQLAGTNTVSLQQAIARLLESEMQKVMIAQGTDEYAFRIIDEAQPPARRARPKRALIVSLSFLAALVVSALGAMVLDQVRGAVATAKTGKFGPVG